jgi:hypothetical protein
MIRTAITKPGDMVETSCGITGAVVSDTGADMIKVRNVHTHEESEVNAVGVRLRYRLPSGSVILGPSVGAIDELDAIEQLQESQP